MGSSGQNEEGDTGQSPEGGGQNAETQPEESNPYVNGDGQLIDPATGELITEDSEGFETPVSGILGGSGSAPVPETPESPESSGDSGNAG